MNRRNLKLAGLLCLGIAAQSVVSSPIYASAATNITQQQSKVSGTISDGNEPICLTLNQVDTKSTKNDS